MLLLIESQQLSKPLRHFCLTPHISYIVIDVEFNNSVGDRDGATVGAIVGTFVGIFVEALVGAWVGTFVGALVGPSLVGTLVGVTVGESVGTSVGEAHTLPPWGSQPSQRQSVHDLL